MEVHLSKEILNSLKLFNLEKTLMEGALVKAMNGTEKNKKKNNIA